MLGNVAEWVADRYSWDVYQHDHLSNPQGPTEGETRVLRGGSFIDGLRFIRLSRRSNEAYPGYSAYWLGFRCALTAPE